MSEINYRLMLDALAGAVVASDEGRRIVYANAAAGRLFGWEPPALVGQPLATILPPRIQLPRRSDDEQASEAGAAIPTLALRKDGTTVAVELSLATVRHDDRDLFVASLREWREPPGSERRPAEVQWLQAITEATANLGSRPGLDGVLETVVTTLNGAFEAALARVWRFDPALGTLRLRAEGGPSRPSPEPLPLEIDAASLQSEVAEAARLGLPVIVEDPSGDARLDPEWVGRERIAWGTALPLRAGGELWGVIAVYTREAPARDGLAALNAFVAVAATTLHDAERLLRAQAARAEAESQHRRLLSILETLPLGVVLAEPSGDWFALENATAAAIWGEAIRGCNMSEYAAAFPLLSVRGDLIAQEDRPLCRALHASENVRGTYRRMREEDGDPMVLEVTATPLPGPEGGAVGTFRDITEQDRLEMQLAERAALIKALLDHLPVGVAYFEDDGVCRASNGPARRILGISRHEVVEELSPDLLTPSPELDEALSRCIREAMPHAKQGVPWPDPAGVAETRYLDWRFEPLPFPSEKRRGALALIVDVTERTLAERALQEAKESAERTSRHKSQFLSAVSHDLRTPVNALSLQAELLSHMVVGPGAPDARELRDLSADMRTAAGGLVELINDLLDLSWFDSGEVQNRPTEFSLQEWLSATLVPLAPTARARGLDLFWRPDRPGRVVRADRVKLSRVLVNLVGNAIKFTEAGRVEVTAGADAEGWFALVVRDTGPGIPEDQKARIFDEFAQLRNPERDRTKGTGLGLAICRRLVEAVGGKLSVAGGLGQGSQFTARYPPGHLGDGPTPEVPAPDGPAIAAMGRKTILLVEDDDNSRRPLSRLLQHAGFAVEPARDGAEALAFLARERPALILLDLMLPGTDGVEVLRRIRAEANSADEGLPVVILSGDVLGWRIREAQRLGIAGLLAKPVDFHELQALVNQILSP